MYYAKVKWSDDYGDNQIDYIFVCAGTYAEALSHIEETYKYIDCVEIELVNEPTNIIYVPEDCVEAVKKENQY